jgi:5'(3')-deoxyribonucleotidase
MKRLKIGIDLDGVCADFLSSAYAEGRKLFNKPAEGAIQTGWGFETIGITNEETKQLWDVIDAIPNWWMELAKLPDTETLNYICQEHLVYFITNRKEGSGFPIELQSALWLVENHGIIMPTVLVNPKKGPLAKALALDYFIDDNTSNCTDVASSIGTDKVFIKDATYNQDSQMQRVKNLDEFLQKIGAMDVPNTGA